MTSRTILFAVVSILFLDSSETPAQSIHLEDVCAGGDGSLSAPSENTGVDPRTGLFATTRFNGRLFDSDATNPSPVPDSPYVDSVFFIGPPPAPVVGTYDQAVTQSGVSATFSALDATGSGWNYILKDRVGGVSDPGIRVGGLSGFTTAIGIHASMGITFDLDQLRARHGANAVGCFSTFWGLDDCAIGQISLYAFVSNDSGVIASRSLSVGPGQGDFVSLEIPPEARYLTLATGAGGSDNCDHGTFARPIITPQPCPEPSYTWVWDVRPSRVSPAGEAITINGEYLEFVFRVRVGGLDLLHQSIEGSTRITGVTPALPVGFHDVELIDANFKSLVKLPGAIEVAPPPALTSVYPATVLSDRPTFAYVYGENLRSDMTVYLDDGFSDGYRALDNQIYLSEEAFEAYLPALGIGVPVGPKTIVLFDQGRYYFYPDRVTYVDVGLERVDPSTVSTEGGTDVTFFGLNLSPGMTIRLDGAPLTEVDFVDSSTVRGKTPPLDEGYGNAELLNSNGEVIFTLQNAVVAVPPGPITITSVSPPRIFSLGGTEVTVVTSSAHGSVVARVNGIPFVNPTAVDAVTLKGEAPSLPPGRYDVDLVDDSESILAVAQGALEIVADDQITISGVSPAIVSTLGGTEVTMTGTGFSLGFVPRIGGLPLRSVELTTTSSLRGITQPLEPGPQTASLESGKLVVASLRDAVQAVAPDVPEGMYVGHVRPARLASGSSRVRFVGTRFDADLVPRIGGFPLGQAVNISPCRFEGTTPALPPGRYKADLFRPGFGVVAEVEGLVEVANAGAPPRPAYIVSEPVLKDGSTRLFVFGNDFSDRTIIIVGGKPLSEARFISDELIVGRAPALDLEETLGLRDIVAEDERGSSRLENALRYEDPASDGTFVRGDANASGRVDLSDAIYILGFLFLGNPTEMACLDSADIDATGSVDLTDAIYLLHHLFLGGREPPAPYPACDQPAQSLLGCGSFAPCGGTGGGNGGGGATATFHDNLKLIEESPVSALDPTVVEIAPEEGEIVVRDPPGGKEIQIGDVIAGFTPVRSDAIHNGVAYMLKVEEAIDGSCLAAGAADKVFRVRPATLKEAVVSGEIQLKQHDFFGSKIVDLDYYPFPICNVVQGGGAGGGAEQGGGGSGVFFDVDFGSFGVIDYHDGGNHLSAGFYKSKVRYNSGVNMGLGIGAGKLTRLTFFAGLLLESEVEFFVDAGLFGQIQKEVRLIHLEKGTIAFLGPVPVLLTAATDLYAGVNLDAGINMYLDVGAAASYKAGLGFEFNGSELKNISGFEPPSLTPIPDTPIFNVEGFAQVKGYIRPEVKVFGGLLIKAVTGELQLRTEIFGRAHVDGTLNPPCFHWGLDAGAKVTMNPEIQLFGYDLFDETFDLVSSEWPNFLSGEVGCKAAPVVKLKNRLENTALRTLIHLDASGSYDPDGGPLEFRWDFDNDGVCDQNTGSNPRVTYEFDPAHSSPCGTNFCTHNIRLRVTDDEQTFTERTTSFQSVGNLGKLVKTPMRLP